MKKCNVLDWIALLLVVVGAVNWGLWGALEVDLVHWLFIQTLDLIVVARVVYIIVGLAGIYLLIASFMKHGCCCSSCDETKPEPKEEVKDEENF